MLQIRLRKPSPENVVGAVVKPLPVDAVTVACPDHLVLADLPVAKGIGSAPSAATVKNVGRRSRRLLGERVHFCVRCDFPIAIYGRLSPCEHSFCLDCARSDTICYLCDERIQKIQTIKLMEGIFICAAPHCLKSFLKRSEFETHIQENHGNLLHPNAEKDDGNESEVQSAKQSTASGSSVRPPPRPVISPGSNSQLHQLREQPLQRPMMQPNPSFYGQAQNYLSESHSESNRPQVFDRHGLQNHFHQGIPGAPQQDSGQFSDKQQGTLSEASMSEYPPMHGIQPPPNFIVPMNSNPSSTPPFGMLPPFQPESGQQFFGSPYDMGQASRPDSAQEVRPEQGSMLSFPPGVAGGVNFANHRQHWNAGQSPVGQGTGDGFANEPDAQGNVAFYQGDYGRNASVMPMMPPPPPSMNKGMEGMPGANAVDPRDSRGVVVQQSYQHPPRPPLPLPHAKRGKYYSGDMGHDGQGFGWQHENRDGFGSGQQD